jgi:erythromycin esterase
MSVVRRFVVAGATALSLSLVAAPVRASVDDPVRALDRHAQPIRTTEASGPTADLRGLERAVRQAKVVAIGEATHSSHEFFTLKHRVFRHLVEQKGFQTFALEVSWNAGLRLNDYVLRGKGDPATILRHEDSVWATREYVDLLHWMREYNRTHHLKLQFMGNDPVYPGKAVFAELTGRLGQHQALLPAYRRLQASLQLADTQAEAWLDAYSQRPLKEREALAADAVALHAKVARGSTDAWAIQHALVIAQTLQLLAFDFTRPEVEIPRAMLFRDRAMADNTTWWHRRTGEKILLSAHNGHVGYVSADPQNYPKLQGAFLRDQLGSGYVNVGLTFDHGRFNAQDDDGAWHVFGVGAAPAGYNEHTLDRVRYRDFLIDTRTAPAAARRWLDETRPTRDIGTAYPSPDRQIALGCSYDLVIHLHRITPAQLLPPQTSPLVDFRSGRR